MNSQCWTCSSRGGGMAGQKADWEGQRLWEYGKGWEARGKLLWQMGVFLEQSGSKQGDWWVSSKVRSHHLSVFLFLYPYLLCCSQCFPGSHKINSLLLFPAMSSTQSLSPCFHRSRAAGAQVFDLKIFLCLSGFYCQTIKNFHTFSVAFKDRSEVSIWRSWDVKNPKNKTCKH